MTRTILVHLNVEVPDSDEDTPNELADAIVDALADSVAYRGLRDLQITAPLAEEV